MGTIESLRNHIQMTLRVWILFLMMETMACLSPGPAVLLVMSQGLSRGVLASIWSSCGILTANALYFAASATGIAAILLGSKTLFNVITWVGAAYTIWLGVRTLASSGAAVSASAIASASPGKMFTNGFVLQVSKPGLLLFFVAVLPQFIVPGRGVAGQVLILAVTSISVEFIILSLYGVLSARIGRLAIGARLVTLANRLAGVMLILAAVALARTRL
jgi:homoserine/homoserine lactone efflux protein